MIFHDKVSASLGRSYAVHISNRAHLQFNWPAPTLHFNRCAWKLKQLLGVFLFRRTCRVCRKGLRKSGKLVTQLLPLILFILYQRCRVGLLGPQLCLPCWKSLRHLIFKLRLFLLQLRRVLSATLRN